MAGRTVYYTATTLDGFIADPSDSLAWLFVQDIDQSAPLGYEPFIADIGALVMGSTTYEWLHRHLAATGEPVGELAAAFGIGRATAYRYIAQNACD